MKSLLQETISLFIHNLQALSKIAIPLLLVMSVADFYAMQSNEQNIILTYVWWVISLLTFCLLSSALIIFLSQVIYGQNISTKDSLLGGIIYVPYLFLVYMLVFAPFLGFTKLIEFVQNPSVNTPMLIFGVIAFVYIGLKCSFASYFIVLEEEKPITAIAKSFHFTKGYIADILLASISLAIPISIMQTTYEILINNFASIKPVLTIGGEIFFSFLFVLIHICIFKIFCMSFSKYKQQCNKA